MSSMDGAPRGRFARSLVFVWKSFKWTVIVVTVLLVTVRAALPWLVPFAARKAGETVGLAVQLEDFSLSLFTGDVSLAGLDVRPQDGQGMDTGESIVALRRFAADLAMGDLLDGVVRVRSVAVEGLELAAERRADGSIVLPRLLQEKLAAPAPAAEPPAVEDAVAAPEAEPAAPKPHDFTLPVQVDSVTIANLRARVKDGAVSPALDRTLELDLDLRSLGKPGQPFAIEVRAAVPQLVDAIRIAIDGSIAGPRATAAVSVGVSRVQLAPLVPYLAPAGLTPTASQLDFGVELEADVDATGRAPGELGARVAVERLGLRADLAEAFALDRFELEVGTVSESAIRVGRVLLSGLRGAARRSADGTLYAAGFAIAPPPAASGSTESSAETVAASTNAPIAPPVSGEASKPAPSIAIASIDCSDLRFAFRDDAMVPPLAVEPRVLSFTTRDLVIDEKVAERPLAVKLAFALPGILERLDLAAQSAVTGDTRTFAVELGATGVNAVALEPWMQSTGLVPTLRNGALTLKTSGQLEPAMGAPKRLAARLEGVRLSEGGELFGLDGLAVSGVSLGEDVIEVASVTLDNPRVTVRREADGTLIVPALRVPATKSASAEPIGAAAPVEGGGAVASSSGDLASPPPPPAKAPEFVLGNLTWKNAKLRFEDAGVAPERAFTLQDVALAIDGVRVGANGLAQPVRLEFDAAVDGLMRAIRLELDATARTAGADLDAAATVGVSFSGLDMDAIAPYLRAAPIDPTFSAADFGMRAIATIKTSSDTLRAGVEVSDLALTDGANTLFGMSRLSVREALVSPTAIDVGALEVAGVRLAAERLPDGGLVACGVALVPPPPQAAVVSAPASQASSSGGAAVAADRASEAPAAAPSPAIRLARLAVDDVVVGWKDAAVSPAVDTALSARLGLEDLVLGADPPSARFGVGIALAGSLDRMTLEGTVVPNPDDLRIAANLAIAGLRPDAVAGYLEAAPEITLRDGRVEAMLEARLAKAAAGGQDAALAVRGFSYRDGEQDPFLAFDEFAVVAPRLDAQGGVFDVASLRLAGFETSAARTEEGGMRLLGIALPPPTAPDAARSPEESSAPNAAPPGTEPAAAAPPTPSEIVPPKALAVLARVGELDLDVKRVAFTDAAKPDQPYSASLHLKSVGPIVIDSNERTEPAPPIQLNLAAHVEPLGSDIALALHAEPLAAEPLVRSDLRITGIDAAKLAQLVPGVFDTSEPPRIVDGVFETRAEGRLIFRRRGPLDFDVSRGFGAVVQVDDVAFREKPDGEILAGLDSLRASVKRMAPSTGDVHLDQIEVSTPRLSLIKRTGYTEVAGLRFPNPPPAAPDAAAAVENAPPTSSAPSETAPPSPPAPEVAAVNAGPKPEIRVDEILVHGIAVNVRDETVSPPLVLPLEKLEVEVRNATTRALEQPVPVRFNVQVGAGKVDLPVRKEPEPLVPSVTDLAGGVTSVGTEAIGTGIAVGRDAVGAGLEVGKGALDAGTKGVEKVGGAIGDALGGALSGLGLTKDEPKPAESEAEPAPIEPAADATPPAEAPPAEEAPPAPVELEARPLFDEIELKGQVALVPKPKGNVDVRISGFELLGVKGAASAAGVTISDGLFDLGVQTRLLGADGIGINTVASFENLSLTEPANGPISRYLQLPAPLDVVVIALRDEEGVMRIPLRVSIQPDDISITGILASVTATLAEMVGRAILHSPLRAVGTVGDISGAAMGAVGLDNVGLDTVGLDKVGLDKGLGAIGLGGDDEPKAEDRTEFGFGTAETLLHASGHESARRIATTLEAEPETKLVLSHRLVRRDVERAKELVNPATRESIDEFVDFLKRRRVELSARRDEALAELRVKYVYGDPWSVRDPAAKLRVTQDELGRIEESLDDLYDLTAPEAERRKDTRARAGALAVAAQRLAEVRRAIVAAGGADVAARIEIQTPRFVIDPAEAGAVIADLKRGRSQ